MANGLTITYKGTTLHSSSEDETFTLNTSGKYMEGNIIITAENVSSLDVTYNNNTLVSESSASGTWTLNTAGKLMEDNVSFDVVVTPPPYITFSSPSSFTLKRKSTDSTPPWDGTLEYSTDKTTWTTWTGTTISSVNNVLYLRGSNNTKITGNASHPFVLTGSNISCTGNIENLLDYTTVSNGNHPTMATSCFMSLFSGNTNLITAPTLPAISLSESCYQSMFFQCSSLVTPPALPAQTLVGGCYCSMFSGCTALTSIPTLVATELPRAAYESMFKDCTSLTSNLDLRSVTTIYVSTGGGPLFNSASGFLAPNTNISVLYGSALTTVEEKAFTPITYDENTPTTVSNYFYFTDNDTVAFNATYLVSVGSSKSTVTNNIYTDNTTIKNAVLTKVDEYTIVNVYHLDGSDW